MNLIKKLLQGDAKEREETKGSVAELREKVECNAKKLQEKCDALKVNQTLVEERKLVAEIKVLANSINEDYFEWNQQVIFDSMADNSDNLITWYNPKHMKVLIYDIVKNDHTSIKLPGGTLAKGIRRFIGGPATVKVDSDLYFLGGFTGEQALNCAFKMPLQHPLGALAKLAPLEVARYDIGAAQILKKHLYAISGSVHERGTETYVSVCETYDITKNQWRRIRPVNIGRAAAGVTAFNDRYIFVYGSQTAASVRSNSIESYDALDGERGWVIHRNAELPIGFVNTFVALMCQVSNNELMIVTNGFLYTAEVKNEKIVKATQREIQYSGCSYNRMIVHKGKVYVTADGGVYLYDLHGDRCFKEMITFT